MAVEVGGGHGIVSFRVRLLWLDHGCLLLILLRYWSRLLVLLRHWSLLLIHRRWLLLRLHGHNIGLRLQGLCWLIVVLARERLCLRAGHVSLLIFIVCSWQRFFARSCSAARLDSS